MGTDAAAIQEKPFRRLRAVGFWMFLRYNETRSWLGYVTFGLIRRRRQFQFAGKDYRYFGAHYNDTWANERAVELPVVLKELTRFNGREILEVGNVLNHYVELPHDVVDKYETASGVINQDVLEFSPDKRYDLIVSISTLEHVGFDEDVRDPEKPVRVVARLRNLLRPGGKLLITFPLGYNPDLDQRLVAGALEFDEVRYLRRVSRSNRWREVPEMEVSNSTYGAPFPKANALVFAVGNRDANPSG